MRVDARRDVGVVLAIGAAFALALLFQVPFANGPDFARWPWRSLPLGRAALLFAPPLAAYAYLLRCWCVLELSKRTAALLVAGLVACSVAFQCAALYADPRGSSLMIAIILSPGATSYFTDAMVIDDVWAWLPNFAHAELNYHSQTHPPGPILYYFALLKLLPTDVAVHFGGALIGVLASAGVALIYSFAALWTPDRRARLGACFLYALSPALIAFFPEFDQVYPLFAMAMIVLWARALARFSAALWLGLVLFAASFMAYNLITVGAFMAPYALLWLHRERWQKPAIARCAVAAGLALGVALAAHVALWSATSFHAYDSFGAALDAQRHFSRMGGPYRAVVFSQLYDFFLGCGMMTLPLLVISLLRRGDVHFRADHALTWLAIFAVIVVDLTGLLRYEAARVWLFLQPLVFVPAGIALAGFDGVSRALVLALQAVIMILVRCKLLMLTF